jgi:hypothetical protein
MICRRSYLRTCCIDIQRARQSVGLEAIRLSWIVVSFAGLLVALLPFALSESVILSVVPICRSIASGQGECILCGMTTSFILIGDVRFSEALESNNGSIALIGLLALNGVTMIALLLKRMLPGLTSRIEESGLCK